MPIIIKSTKGESGVILISVLLFLTVMIALTGLYFKASRIEQKTTAYIKDSTSGFYMAEAGLNLRAEEIRAKFEGYNTPIGTSPSDTAPCEGTNLGTDDYACQTYTIGKRSAQTYLTEDPDNPIITTIPPGETFQGLNAIEYRYTANSFSLNPEGRKGTNLELRFKSRLVPLFQFVAFYDKDLEIQPGPPMVLNGPIHTNGDLYLGAYASLDVIGQITTAGLMLKGRKNDLGCAPAPVQVPVGVANPTYLAPLKPVCPYIQLLSESYQAAWNGMLETLSEPLEVPELESMDPTPGAIYWDKADLRLVLNLDNSTGLPDTTNSVTGVEVRNADETINQDATDRIHDSTLCPGLIGGIPVGTTNSFFNNRIISSVRMLEVDAQGLFDCIHTHYLSGDAVLQGGRNLDDDTEGGLVLYLTVDGPNSSASNNNYGVRTRNSQTLQSTISGAAEIKGVTFISDQASYTAGDFNSVGKIPAAVMSDALNILSNNWDFANEATKSNYPANNSAASLSNRVASNTVFNAGVVSGTDTTGGIEGIGGVGVGLYNGGLENFPRFHENWSGRTFTYRGSFVSLGNSRHQTGFWIYGTPQYTAPNRDWDYDTDFNDAANLPPLTPRFVYLRQELFVRDFGE